LAKSLDHELRCASSCYCLLLIFVTIPQARDDVGSYKKSQ